MQILIFLQKIQQKLKNVNLHNKKKLCILNALRKKEEKHEKNNNFLNCIINYTIHSYN